MSYTALSKPQRAALLYACKGHAFVFTSEDAHEAVGATVETLESLERRGYIVPIGAGKWKSAMDGERLAAEIEAAVSET